MKPHCPFFKPSATAPWVCRWWDSEESEIGVEHFCSRPDWDERICETGGQHNKSEAHLVANVARHDVGEED
jgi:hypothetical protein